MCPNVRRKWELINYLVYSIIILTDLHTEFGKSGLRSQYHSRRSVLWSFFLSFTELKCGFLFKNYICTTRIHLLGSWNGPDIASISISSLPFYGSNKFVRNNKRSEIVDEPNMSTRDKNCLKTSISAFVLKFQMCYTM